jgi:hypothetical protein
MSCTSKFPIIAQKHSLLFFLVILLYASPVHSEDVILTWDRPDDDRVSGYKVFYGPAEDDFKSFPKEIIESPDQTACDIYNLTAGKRYGFAAKSMDDYGNESVFSELIFYDVPKEQDDSPDDGNNDNGNSDKDGGGGGGCFLDLL